MKRASIKQRSISGYGAVAKKYAEDVVSGKILACKWVRLACQRHLNDLEASRSRDFPYEFRESKAKRACKFVELMPHVKGRWAAHRETLKLEPWQVFVVAVIFGWVCRDTGLRKYRQAYICVPRKNGKSPLASGLGLYMFAADGEFGAEVYCGATTERQAWEVFRPAKQMAERTPELLEQFGIQINAKSMVIESNGSRFEPVIGKPGDGAAPSCGICDEFHEADSAELYDTLLTGMIGREQPLLIVITTAGFNVAGPCHTLQVEAQKVLDGVLEDDRLFAIIFTIDEGDDWTSVEALRKANPNYGVSVEGATLRHDQLMAVKNSAKQNTFKTKHLNIWCNANVAWMNMVAWAAGKDEALTPEQFSEDPCIIAVDLASTTDLASAIKIFIRQLEGKQHYYLFGRHYLPEDRIQQPECQHYQKWFNDGVLIATDGAAIDYGQIKADLAADIKAFVVREVCYDKTYAGQLMQELNAETGVTVVEVPQKTMYLSPAMKALEAAVLDGRVHHNGDPVLTWAMSNVVAHVDANENVFPRKDKPELKIDPAVATITGMSRATVAVIQPKYQPYLGIQFV